MGGGQNHKHADAPDPLFLLRARRKRPSPPHRLDPEKFPPPHAHPPSEDGIVPAQTSALIGSESASLLQHEMLADVRFGSLGDMAACPVMSALPPIADIRRLCSDVR